MDRKISFLFALLWGTQLSAQTQSVVTGANIPDAAAWRIWLNQKSEVSGNHTEAFTTYLGSLPLSPEDVSRLQTVLESYAAQEVRLRTTTNAKIDEADQKADAATATRLQSEFETKMTTLVSITRTQVVSQLSVNDAKQLTEFVLGEKRHMTISPLDMTLARTPQDAEMGFNYSTYGSIWMTVAGRNAEGEPHGTFYHQIGVQGSTESCAASCLSAYHTATTSYNHAGSGVQRQTIANQHANTEMNANQVYSWPFDPKDNYWPNETAELDLQSSLIGTILNMNPMYPVRGDKP
jgi:hypothetical protein